MAVKQTVIGWWFGEGAEPDRVGVYVFEHDESIEDPEQALRDAAEKWLKTKKGRDANENVSGDFNWGDLMLCDKIQKLAKVFLVNNFASDCVVNQRLGEG